MEHSKRTVFASVVSAFLTSLLVLVVILFICYKPRDIMNFIGMPSEFGEMEAEQQEVINFEPPEVEHEFNSVAEHVVAKSESIMNDDYDFKKFAFRDKLEEKRLEEERKIIEAKRKAEEARKRVAAEAEAKRKAEAEKKRLAELEAKKKAEAEEQKRLNEIALKKKQDEEKKLKEEQERQKKVAEEKRQQELAKQKEQDAKKAEEKKQQDAKAAADKKAADEKRKAEEAKKAAEAKAKAEAEAKAKAAAAAKAKAEADAKARAEAAENERIANAYLGNASFVGAMQQALYDNWSTGAEMIGYTATVVFYVDAQGNIVKIDDSKSKYSGFQPFDDSVKAAVMRTKKIKMPDNKHAVNKLVKEGIAVTFDPKDYGFVNY